MSIEDSASIDLITEHPEHGYVSLIMIQEAEWPDRIVAARQLQDKLNMYFVYALDGQMLRDYPGFAGKRLRIQLDYMAALPSHVVDLVHRMQGVCQDHGIEFIANQLKYAAGAVRASLRGATGVVSCRA